MKFAKRLYICKFLYTLLNMFMCYYIKLIYNLCMIPGIFFAVDSFVFLKEIQTEAHFP